MAAKETAEKVEGMIEGSQPKSKPLLVIGGIVGLLVMSGVGVYFMSVFDGRGSTSVAEVEEETLIPTEITYYDFPQILVNLNEPGKKEKFLKLAVVFELESADVVPVIEKLEPRIIDQLQMYMRELRFENLQDSKDVHRLRKELLRRVNSEIGKNKVKDVLFKNILVQ